MNILIHSLQIIRRNTSTNVERRHNTDSLVDIYRVMPGPLCLPCNKNMLGNNI